MQDHGHHPRRHDCRPEVSALVLNTRPDFRAQRAPSQDQGLWPGHTRDTPRAEGSLHQGWPGLCSRTGREPAGNSPGPSWPHLNQARRRVPSLLKVLLPVLLLDFQSKARPQNALQVIRVRPCASGHSPPPPPWPAHAGGLPTSSVPNHLDTKLGENTWIFQGTGNLWLAGAWRCPPGTRPGPEVLLRPDRPH